MAIRLSWDNARKIVNATRHNRPPETSDFKYPVPTVWVDELTNIAYLLLDITTNVALWLEVVDADRVSGLENTNVRIEIFEEVSSTSGSLSAPTGATIILDQFAEDVDALCTTITSSGQKPNDELATTAAGVVVTCSLSGGDNSTYTLSGTPSGSQYAIQYVVDLPFINFKDIDRDILLAFDEISQISELNDVKIVSVSNEQALIFDSSDSLWKNIGVLLLSGGTMTGDIDMGDKEITNAKQITVDTAQTRGSSTGLMFGDGDTGFYEYIDDRLVFQCSGSATMYLHFSSLYGMNTSGGFAIRTTQGVSSIVPNYTFNGDLDTGLNRAGADQLSLIAGGVEGHRITEDGGIAHDITGSVAMDSIAKSADYTVLDNDGVNGIEMTAGATDKTVTLPTLADNQGRIIPITLMDNAAGNCIVDGEGAEPVNGELTLTISYQWSTAVLKATATGWIII